MSKRGLIAVSIVLLAVFTAGAVLATYRPPPFQGLDDAWLEMMRSSRTPAATWAARALDILGGTVVAVLMTVALTVYCLLRRAWPVALFVVAATMGTRVLTTTTKMVVGRERPPDGLVDAAGWAYPSGHVSGASALTLVAALLVWRFTRARLVMLLPAITAVVMAWDRTYLGVHWLTDTIAAAVLATGVTLFAWALLREAIDRRPPAPSLTAPSLAAVEAAGLAGAPPQPLHPPTDVSGAPPPDR